METHRTAAYRDPAVEAARDPQKGNVAFPLGVRNGDACTPLFPHKLDDLDVSIWLLTDLALKAASLDPD